MVKKGIFAWGTPTLENMSSPSFTDIRWTNLWSIITQKEQKHCLIAKWTPFGMFYEEKRQDIQIFTQILLSVMGVGVLNMS